MCVSSNVVEGFNLRSSTLTIMLKSYKQPLITNKCTSCASVCDACCLSIYFRLLSTRILGLTLVSFVFHVTVEPQLEEEQYGVAEHDYTEEQDQGQYSEQGKPTSPL